MTINSKKKGKTGELECAKILRGLGFPDVRRTAQYNGKELDSKADLVGIEGCHLEVKRNEHLNIFDAMEQADRDSKENETPVVLHRKNGKPWLVTMHIEDWALREHIFIKEWQE